ncbi:MAG: hypothetical protein ABIQ55_02930 [Gemmatimonadaceae bacterium]
MRVSPQLAVDEKFDDRVPHVLLFIWGAINPYSRADWHSLKLTGDLWKARSARIFF